MFFKNTVVAIAIFVSSALGAITFTSAPSSVVAGQTYNLKWSADGSGPVTIILRKGDPQNLQTVGTITSAGTGGDFAWTAPALFAPGTDYAFQITQGTETNYYGPFAYSGGVAVSAAPVVSSAVAASSGSAAAPSGSVASVSAPAMSSYPTLSQSGYKNSTSTATTLKSSSSSASASSAAKPSASPVSANSAVAIGSPLALVLGAVAAMLYLQ